jgi:hypothetical protein
MGDRNPGEGSEKFREPLRKLLCVFVLVCSVDLWYYHVESVIQLLCSMLSCPFHYWRLVVLCVQLFLFL